MMNLKKENAQLGATLKRYRQQLQDLTNKKNNDQKLNKQSINLLDGDKGSKSGNSLN